MASLAKDMSAILKAMMTDTELLDLMMIPESTRNNLSELESKYFIQSTLADILTLEPLIRLLIRSSPQNSTANMFVRRDSFSIDIFVPKSTDKMPQFERRLFKIADRLIAIFHNKRVNDKLVELENKSEQYAVNLNFARYFVSFTYKNVYC